MAEILDRPLQRDVIVLAMTVDERIVAEDAIARVMIAGMALTQKTIRARIFDNDTIGTKNGYRYPPQELVGESGVAPMAGRCDADRLFSVQVRGPTPASSNHES